MNPNDDDRSARSQVTLRLDRDLLTMVDNLARDEGVDRTELVRRLLADGLAHRRIQAAIGDYAAGRRSAWSAAELAGVDLYEMLDRIAEAGLPYLVDPEALDRLRAGNGSPPSGPPPTNPQPPRASGAREASITALRRRYRPSVTRMLFVGESSPAGATHFYRADSNLYRATREAFGVGLSVADPPEGEAFLTWFQELGCWLVDLADRPVNRSAAAERTRAVDAGIPALARTIRELQPARILVVLRRIAPAVRRAARVAGFDDRAIDVLPFPTRQWRPVYVDQLAGMLPEVLGSETPSSAPWPQRRAIAEQASDYGSPGLHTVIASVLRGHGNAWMKSSAIAREIADADLWRRPSDGRHPPPSQISARARARPYADLFQTSDLGIRLRVEPAEAARPELDPIGIALARRMREGLSEIYRKRLRGVFLYGSRARGEQGPDSDVDILIVLDRVGLYGEELERTSKLASDLSLDAGVIVSRTFASEVDWQTGAKPFLVSARAEAIEV